MHSKTLKRKNDEAMELANFIAEWTDPYPVPDFTLWRPTKTRRSNRAIGLFHVPDPPPNTPATVYSKTSRAKGKAKIQPHLGNGVDGFRPTPIQKSWILKKPFLEARYRRTHKLKTDFANTAVPVKAALVESAKRTLTKLDEDEHWHEEGSNRLNHHLLVRELKRKMNGKIEYENTNKKLQMTVNEGRFEYEKATVEMEFRRKVGDIREKALAQIRDDMVWGGCDMDEDESVRATIPQVRINLGARS